MTDGKNRGNIHAVSVVSIQRNECNERKKCSWRNDQNARINGASIFALRLSQSLRSLCCVRCVRCMHCVEWKAGLALAWRAKLRRQNGLIDVVLLPLRQVRAPPTATCREFVILQHVVRNKDPHSTNCTTSNKWCNKLHTTCCTAISQQVAGLVVKLSTAKRRDGVRDWRHERFLSDIGFTTTTTGLTKKQHVQVL